MTLRSWSAAAIATTCLFTASPALACKCVARTAQQAIAATPIVFEGRVMSVRREGARAYATIEMIRPIKGAVPRVVEVGTAAESAACGYAFRKGQRLTVGAEFREQQFSTTLCTMLPLNAR